MPMLKNTLVKILKIAASGAVIYYVVNFLNNFHNGSQSFFLLLLSSTVTVILINAFVAIVMYVLFPYKNPSEKSKKRNTLPL